MIIWRPRGQSGAGRVGRLHGRRTLITGLARQDRPEGDRGDRGPRWHPHDSDSRRGRASHVGQLVRFRPLRLLRWDTAGTYSICETLGVRCRTADLPEISGRVPISVTSLAQAIDAAALRRLVDHGRPTFKAVQDGEYSKRRSRQFRGRPKRRRSVRAPASVRLLLSMQARSGRRHMLGPDC